ncbi:MAG TPA: aminotransferase class I/II-fold pyridoxal phosphate-dependent enzyme [Bacteroidales bacterium]|nr:aminotransferase class I/II-fold pyridoxal phosphate-dependent enzyme [Bacteroidales bacterium]
MKNFDPASNLFNASISTEHNGVNPSITDSATYFFESGKDMTKCFLGENNNFLYSRHWNPSNLSLSKALSAMEGTESAWVTSSGMAAITSTILQLVNSGDHLISSLTTYGGTFAFFKNWLQKINVEVSFVDITNLQAVEKAIRPNTKLIYTETMTNPLLQISDIPELADIAHKHNLKLVVDNTFTPMIFSPYQLGADIVVYSMTKFINGKNDTTAGAICTDSNFINSLIDLNNGTAMLLGPVLDPLRSSNILKNLYTLHIRMKQHSKNATYLAEKLTNLGIKINYPGLPEHPGHKVMERTMNKEFGYGGMLVLDLGNSENADKFMTAFQNKGGGYLAVSLGYFKTLLSNSGKSTSSEVPEDFQKQMGLTEGLIRLSTGLDNDIDRLLNIFIESLKAVDVKVS